MTEASCPHVVELVDPSREETEYLFSGHAVLWADCIPHDLVEVHRLGLVWTLTFDSKDWRTTAC